MAKRFVRDDLDKLMDHGFDPSSRTIFLMDDIDEFTVEPAMKALHVLDRSAGDITIRLTSNGGDWYSGMALYDAIQACENEVTIIGMGQVMSMGGIILQAADHRILSERATVLVHYGSDWYSGHVKDMIQRAKEAERGNRDMEDLFLARIREKHPGFTREQFKQKFTFDVYMSAQEAVDFGLADSILGG